MTMFRFQEMKYYGFGLKAGLRNLKTNRFALGVKKSLGKISQPINSYTRFPEYHFFDSRIREFLASLTPTQLPRILDVGSPKLFGLYLASSIEATFALTDISPLNIEEYKMMWRALERSARGRAQFDLQDARALQFADGSFDVVYSMSVIEHVEGPSGDSDAVRELLRVLRPGGLLVMSMPWGANYLEQQRVGFAGAARATNDGNLYFFQRIYDLENLENRCRDAFVALDEHRMVTVYRNRPWLHRAFASLSENLRGALGTLNPVLSAAINREGAPVRGPLQTQYGKLHSARDVYGDVIISGRKKIGPNS